MRNSRRVHSSSPSSTAVTYTLRNDQTAPPFPAATAAAAKIQSSFRAHLIRGHYKTIAAVDARADDLQRLIQRQDTVDAVRSDERERLRMNEALMGLLLRLDAVPGRSEALREARRRVSRRIVELQEIMDSVASAKLEGFAGGVGGAAGYLWGPGDGYWDEVVAEMEERVCRDRGGEELERFCDNYLGFRCLQRFLSS